jgi:hypothetical protein
MKRIRFTEDQIIGILKEHVSGVFVADLAASTASSPRPGEWPRSA